ncbi:RimJ/RimL family protein N-acetyltransferase [Altererythrobacter atlanticus]|uniref:Ribosomal N-acetyltransferase YdaF n=1 Tax=Croceibacterium atlanticum TaxID=1267766 RepID=A0A0F7KUM7_9SPHN|nr:GNAT family N-acetyltransferase [Croceibacterium atlanticum]AKH42490.1 Putative ribosomal N-acetyltransferase YdaF [Croceibacterium atlanticum]MBB5731267.1 RimJ/RimL family protein N-acetyltransferase [Croceibacterium atlanticum]
MFFPFRTLSTARCRIDPLRAEDAEELWAITDESVTAKVHFLPDPFTLSDARALIAGCSKHDCFLAVRDRRLGHLLGVIGAHRQAGRRIEIGYWFAATARGRGLATESLRAATGLIAQRFPTCRLVAECHPENGPSRALLERIGFASSGAAGKRPGRQLFSQAVSAMRIDVC